MPDYGRLLISTKVMLLVMCNTSDMSMILDYIMRQLFMKSVQKN